MRDCLAFAYQTQFEPRRFTSARKALLWYRNQLASRLRAGRRNGFEQESAPATVAQRERAQATFAAIAGCLKAQHPADAQPEVAAYLASGEQLLWLMAWYESTWGDGTFLADKAGLSRWAFTRRCRRTERVLRERLEWAGLLEGDEPEGAYGP